MGRETKRYSTNEKKDENCSREMYRYEYTSDGYEVVVHFDMLSKGNFATDSITHIMESPENSIHISGISIYSDENSARVNILSVTEKTSEHTEFITHYNNDGEVREVTYYDYSE